MRTLRIVSAQHAAAEQAGETGPLIHNDDYGGPLLRQLTIVAVRARLQIMDHLAEQVCFP